MFGESDAYANSLYTLLDQSGDIYLYQCNETLPFGYVAPAGFELPEDEELNGLMLQTRLVLDLGMKGELFQKMQAQQAKDDVVFVAEETGIYYAILTASGTGKVDYIGGAVETESFRDLKRGSVLYLGKLEQGQTITLTNGDEEDATQKISADVYRMDEAVLEETLNMLSAQHLENVSWESDRISGEITLEREGRLILSVPYEDGWTVLINGSEAERTTFGGCLMAFDLREGQYTVEMDYVPVGQGVGLAVSGVSLLLFMAVIIYRKRNCKK